MRTGVRVREIMTRKPITASKDCSIRFCAQVMKEKNVGSLLITQDQHLLGVLTKSDIITEIVAEGRLPASVPAEEIMTQEIITIHPDKDLYHALVLMKNNDIRHLPVIEQDALIGYITIKDIIKINPALFELIRDTIYLREEERKIRAHIDEPDL